jgi:transcription antitermination factor NusB
MAKKNRARAREIALQALYQYDMSQKGASDIKGAVDLEPFVVHATRDETVKCYALKLIEGCLQRRDELDRRIAATAKHWKLERIAAVDLSILRMALSEMLDVEEVPPKVAINEAIELAKKYSTAQSGSFVNGVLDRLFKEITFQDKNDAEEVVP